MKGFVKFFLNNKALTWLLLILIIAGGVVAYSGMGKLEDAPFTIKQAVVTTTYPGASPLEVQQQVTDVLEESIQSLGELYYLKSDNRAGLSKITVYVKKEIRAKDMQQLWDKLRRKVNDVQNKLPQGAGPSKVNDDFGDVLGVFYSLSSETRSYRELEDCAKDIKNELLNVKDVARLANSQFMPKLSVSIDGSYSSPGYNFKADLNPNYAIYAKLSVPIFEWGKRRNTRKAGKYAIDMATENQRKVTDNVRLEVETAFYNYSQAVRKVSLTESSLNKAEESKELAFEKYREGNISIVEVINAEIYHLEAKVNFIQTKLNAQIARSGLERARGERF